MIPALTAHYEKLVASLHDIQQHETDPLACAKKAVQVCITGMHILIEHLRTNHFQTTIDEIAFFKETKPHFQSLLLYWHFRLQYLLNNPVGGIMQQEEFVNMELQRSKSFFDVHIDFYRYVRSGASYLDHIYFLRGKNKDLMNLDADNFEEEPGLSTSHGLRLAKLYANQFLADFLNNELSLLKEGRLLRPATAPLPLEWTSSQTSLVELIYALGTYGAFNDGKATIGQLVHFFETVFNVRLAGYYRTFQDLRIRKKGRTVFLDGLRDKLIQRMDESDENPR